MERTIIRPIITEKTLKLAEEQNKYTFVVDLESNKHKIKSEIQDKFGVKVENVNTNIRLGKKKVFGRMRKEGRRSTTKNAVVTLKSGDTISVFNLK